LEFFRNTNIDFLGKKWYFLAFSLIFSVAGVMSMLFWHGIPLGVDFRGGTLVYAKYSHTPNIPAISADIDRAGIKNHRIQSYGPASNNEVLISLDIQETSEQALDKGKTQIIQALEGSASAANGGKQDLNNASSLTIANYLLEKNPLHLDADANQRYTAMAQAIVNQRDKVKSGVLGSIDELNGIVDPAAVASLKDGFFVSDFGIRNVEIVGPQVGAQLRKQAMLATLYSLAAMLIYLGLRFEWIYGVAAVLTVFHDTLSAPFRYSIARSR
jgi:preprotein translocase subunit SecF